MVVPDKATAIWYALHCQHERQYSAVPFAMLRETFRHARENGNTPTLVTHEYVRERWIWNV